MRGLFVKSLSVSGEPQSLEYLKEFTVVHFEILLTPQLCQNS